MFLVSSLSAIYKPNNFPRLVKTGGIVFMTFPLHTNVVVVAADNHTFLATEKGVVPCVLDTLTMKHIEVAHHSLLTIYSTMDRVFVKKIYYLFALEIKVRDGLGTQ
jgi:hypothetical protein